MSKLKDLVAPSALPPLPSGHDKAIAGASLPASSPGEKEQAALSSPGPALSAAASSRRPSRPPWWRAWLIFLLGAGLGVLGVLVYQQDSLGKAGEEAAQSALKPGFTPGDWISESLAKYQTTLQLRPEQVNSLRSALQKASHDLRDTQERASREARQAIHLVHAQLMPMLDEKQTRDFEAWRKASGPASADDRLPDFPENAPASATEPQPEPAVETIPEKRKTGREATPKPSGKPAPKAVPIP